jgi:hypothetical protein
VENLQVEVAFLHVYVHFRTFTCIFARLRAFLHVYVHPGLQRGGLHVYVQTRTLTWRFALQRGRFQRYVEDSNVTCNFQRKRGSLHVDVGSSTFTVTKWTFTWMIVTLTSDFRTLLRILRGNLLRKKVSQCNRQLAQSNRPPFSRFAVCTSSAARTTLRSIACMTCGCTMTCSLTISVPNIDALHQRWSVRVALRFTLQEQSKIGQLVYKY